MQALAARCSRPAAGRRGAPARGARGSLRASAAAAGAPGAAPGATRTLRQQVERFHTTLIPDTALLRTLGQERASAALVSSAVLKRAAEEAPPPDSDRAAAHDELLHALSAALEVAASKSNEAATLAERIEDTVDMTAAILGAEFSTRVTGRVTVEVDARLAFDAAAIEAKARKLNELFHARNVGKDRLLFKVPATWEGIQAVRELEADGLQCHVAHAYCLEQVAAAARNGASVVQLYVGRVREKQGIEPGEDPGKDLIAAAHALLRAEGLDTKLIACSVRSAKDVYELAGVEYIIVPPALLASLTDAPALPESDDVPPLWRRAERFRLTAEVPELDEKSFRAAIGGTVADKLLIESVAANAANAQVMDDYVSQRWPWWPNL